MKAVYFKSGTAQWKYELEDDEHDNIIQNLIADSPDYEEMLSDSLEILRDVSAMDDEEMSEDDEIDQSIAVAFIWHYFNNLPADKGRIDGDIVLIEDESGEGVTVVSAEDLTEDEE